MRLAPSLAAVPLLLALLTWLALRGIDSGAQTFNQPLQAL